MALIAAASAAAGAKKLFDYNRENFKFDMDQRLEREEFRFEMQMKRFELFREDVRDLMELTVDRMDIYHLIGALFLEFVVVLFAEGRVESETGAAAPPFLLSLFFLSNACAFIYLLLAVWLSMHASIAAHSFGVRLLTRFVRLPIPSIKQIAALRTQLAEFEKQGASNQLRLPFLSDNKWYQGDKEAAGFQVREAASGREAANIGASNFAGSSKADPDDVANPAAPVVRFADPSSPTDTPARGPTELLPEESGDPIKSGDDLLQGSVGALPERHIQLFRQLQSKWQCYDAYCRVCMGLGANQLLQALSYFTISHTLVENRSPVTGYALIVIFQSSTVALAVLDLAGLKWREILAIQVVGMLPCLLTTHSLASARDDHGDVQVDVQYYWAPVCFLLHTLWFELWLRVAAPSGSFSKMPRRFRAVLFLDVFGDATGWTPKMPDRTSDEDDEARAAEREQIDVAAKKASGQLMMVQSAVRRWKSTPAWAMSRDQQKEVQRICNRLQSSGRTIQDEIDQHRILNGREPEVPVFEEPLSQWSQLPESLRRSDPFRNCLPGRFKHDGASLDHTYHYDPEGDQCVFDDSTTDVRPGARVLTLATLVTMMEGLEEAEREFLELRILRDIGAVEREHEREGKTNDRNLQPRVERFPNLKRLWKKPRATISGPSSMTSSTTDMLAALDATNGTTRGKGPASSGRTSSKERARMGLHEKDPTLLAMAGENADHFAPEKLPWKTLKWVTRMMQLTWIFCSVMVLLDLLSIWSWDRQPEKGERALLYAPSELTFDRLDLRWHYGSLFNPQSLACASALHGGNPILASPFAWYRLEHAETLKLQDPQSLELSEIGRLDAPPSTVVICSGATPRQSCILASPSANSILLQGLDSDAPSSKLQLPISGLPWQRVAGAVMHCGDVAAALLPPGTNTSARCLLLAGWNGKDVPIAVLPLEGDNALMPGRYSAVHPSISLPLAPEGVEVVALDIEPRQGRISAVLFRDHLEVWSLRTAKRLSSWRLRWGRELPKFKPTALCDAGELGLLATGRSTTLGPVLLRALPASGFMKHGH